MWEFIRRVLGIILIFGIISMVYSKYKQDSAKKEGKEPEETFAGSMKSYLGWICLFGVLYGATFLFTE